MRVKQFEIARAGIGYLCGRDMEGESTRELKRLIAVAAGLRGAIRTEQMILQSAQAWPVLTPEERTRLVERKFMSGRYQEPGEEHATTVINERRDNYRANLLLTSWELLKVVGTHLNALGSDPRSAAIEEYQHALGTSLNDPTHRLPRLLQSPDGSRNEALALEIFLNEYVEPLVRCGTQLGPQRFFGKRVARAFVNDPQKAKKDEHAARGVAG